MAVPRVHVFLQVVPSRYRILDLSVGPSDGTFLVPILRDQDPRVIDGNEIAHPVADALVGVDGKLKVVARVQLEGVQQGWAALSGHAVGLPPRPATNGWYPIGDPKDDAGPDIALAGVFDTLRAEDA